GGRKYRPDMTVDMASKTLVPTRMADGYRDVAVFTSAGFGVKTDGTLWSWGFGGLYGELGLGAMRYAAEPAALSFQEAQRAPEAKTAGCGLASEAVFGPAAGPVTQAGAQQTTPSQQG